MHQPYDIVLFGGTGFTGRLVAGYLMRAAPPEARWALAGRSPEKLRALSDELGSASSAEGPEILHADATDPASLKTLAESARVVISTVGPYIEYGEPLVAACAEAGTDYVDLTGEPEFVDRMYVKYHATAVRSGARIVHACGFDSIPHDLGVYYTVQQLPEGVPLRVEGHVRVAGTISGGTLSSMLTIFARGRSGLEAAMERRRAEPAPKGRHISTPLGLPRYARERGGWLLPMPTLDPQVVRRSAAALERYGPDFTYSQYLVPRDLPMAAGFVGGIGALVFAAQIPPVRAWLSQRLAPGDGPSAERRARSWFKVRLLGKGGGRRVVTEVAGGDPGYGETAKMLAESAMCLAYDDLPASAGQVTTAVAMGDALIGRLQRAGIIFRVVTGR